MAAGSRTSRSQAWSFFNRKHVLVQFLLAMSVVVLVSLVSAEEVEILHRISTLGGRTELDQGILKWRSRRSLLQGGIQDRQAPTSFPPPQGNAFVNNPGNAPPGRPFFANNGSPAARLPDNAHRLVPPPHP